MDSNTAKTSPTRSFNPRRDFEYECRICNAGFSDMEELLTHSEMHDTQSSNVPAVGNTLKSEKKMYSCVECTAKFDTYEDLQGHAELHSAIANSSIVSDKVELGGICNVPPVSIFGSVNKQKMALNSDILNRLKERVLPASPSDITDDESSSEKSEIGTTSLECEFCGKAFIKKDNLKRHLRIHTGDRPYACPFCVKCFASPSALTKHIRVHTGEKPYFCKICFSRFSQNSSLKQHALKQHGVVNPSLYVGESLHEPSMKNFTALNVQKVSGETNSLLRPSRNNNIDIHHCKICEIDFDAYDEYETHMQIHNEEHDSNSENRYDDEEEVGTEGNSNSCSICHQRFSCRSSLRRHYRIHSGERPFKCHVCSTAFSQGSTLKKHIQRMHKYTWREMQRTNPFDSRNFRVDGEEGQQYEEVEDDEPGESEGLSFPDVANPDNLDNLRCQYCQVQYSTLRYLTLHERTHTVEKPHSCKWCGRCFGYKSHLNRHVLIHTGEKPYKCRICKTGFRQKVSLSSHIRNHHKNVTSNRSRNGYRNTPSAKDKGAQANKEKPFKCKICYKSFQLRSSLTRHNVYHYGNARKCETCLKQFKTAALLKEHMKTHSGSRPCTCPICGKEFRYTIQVNRHMASHKNEGVLQGSVDVAEEQNMDGQEFFIEDRNIVEVTDDDVDDEESYEKFLSQKREGVIVPFDPELIGENDDMEDPSTSKNSPPYVKDNERGFESGNENYEQYRNGDDEDPTYLPCKSIIRTPKKRSRNQVVSLGSETLLKLSVSMNTGTCSFCGKAFTSRSDMRRHLRTHTGEKPFECNVCRGRFTQKKSLVEHQRMHTGERPHFCKVCNMNFRYRSHLARHIKRNHHYGDLSPLRGAEETPMYSCVACNKEFNLLDELKQHLEAVHGIGEDVNIADDVDVQGDERTTDFTDIAKLIKMEPLEDIDMGAVLGGVSKNPYTCGFCRETFADYDIWIAHLDSHSPSEYTN